MWRVVSFVDLVDLVGSSLSIIVGGISEEGTRLLPVSYTHLRAHETLR